MKANRDLPIQIVDGELCCPNCAGSLEVHSTSTVFHDDEDDDSLKRVVVLEHSVHMKQEPIPDAKENVSAPGVQIVFVCRECNKLPAFCIHFDGSEKRSFIHWVVSDIREAVETIGIAIARASADEDEPEDDDGTVWH